MSARFEVLAVRYGTLRTTRVETFYRYPVYGLPDAPIEMDYFFWVLRSPDEIMLVDCGFDAEIGRRRGRTSLVEPVAALGELGIAPGDVSRIIVSHAHYDHIGNLSRFPDASIVVQRRELDFWTGYEAEKAQFASSTERVELNHLGARFAQGRVRALDGDEEIADGVELRFVGGHTPGQQIVVVAAEDSTVVLASDALHFYEEFERDMPFAVFSDLRATYEAYALLRQLRDAGATIVAGHDPLVMERFGAAPHGPPGRAVRVG